MNDALRVDASAGQSSTVVASAELSSRYSARGCRDPARWDRPLTAPRAWSGIAVERGSRSRRGCCAPRAQRSSRSVPVSGALAVSMISRGGFAAW